MKFAITALAVGMGLVVPASPATAAPVPATCFNYSADQWLQTEFTAATFDCATKHNGEVLGSVTIPADIVATGFGSSAMKAWAFRACQAVSVDYIWRTGTPRYPKASIVLPRTARLSVQIPTGVQWVAGDRWAACLGQSRNVKLSAAQARTGSVRAQGVRPFVCYNPRTWNGANCRTSGAVKMTHQVWLPTSYDAAFPGSGKLLARTQKACLKLKRKRDDLSSWFVPGLPAWDRGNRYGFCAFVK